MIALPGKDRHVLRHLLNSTAYRLLAVALMLGHSSPLLAQSILPQGGTVVGGSATVGTPANNALTITQNSQNAVVNWNSFSIGQPNTVIFNQPNSSSAILNRVTGNTPSTIAGALQANGQVYLVIPPTGFARRFAGHECGRSPAVPRGIPPRRTGPGNHRSG